MTVHVLDLEKRLANTPTAGLFGEEATETLRLAHRLLVILKWYDHTHADDFDHDWHCAAPRYCGGMQVVDDRCNCGWNEARDAFNETGPWERNFPAVVDLHVSKLTAL
jgi:hypothetical protein